jgi:hypothetical protein
VSLLLWRLSQPCTDVVTAQIEYRLRQKNLFCFVARLMWRMECSAGNNMQMLHEVSDFGPLPDCSRSSEFLRGLAKRIFINKQNYHSSPWKSTNFAGLLPCGSPEDEMSSSEPKKKPNIEIPKPYTTPEGFIPPSIAEQWRYVSFLRVCTHFFGKLLCTVAGKSQHPSRMRLHTSRA